MGRPASITILAMRRVTRAVLEPTLLLQWTLNTFAGAIKLPNCRAQRFNLTLFCVFLHLSFFECFESFFHFEKERFEVSVDLLHFFDGLPDGWSGIGAAAAPFTVLGDRFCRGGWFEFSLFSFRMVAALARFERRSGFDCLGFGRLHRFTLSVLGLRRRFWSR